MSAAAERNVSWGEWDDDKPAANNSATLAAESSVNATTAEAPAESQPVPKSTKGSKAKNAAEKQEKRSIPEWTIDTKGDFEGQPPATPTKSSTRSRSKSSRNSSSSSKGKDNNNSQVPPEWPSEEAPMPRLGRGRPGQRQSRPSGRRDLKELEKINLPGVDLSKMPEATTKISFKDTKPRAHARVEEAIQETDSNNACANATSSIAPDHDSVANATSSSSASQSTTQTAPVQSNVNNAVNDVAERIENLGWSDEPECEPVSVPVAPAQEVQQLPQLPQCYPLAQSVLSQAASAASVPAVAPTAAATAVPMAFPMPMPMPMIQSPTPGVTSPMMCVPPTFTMLIACPYCCHQFMCPVMMPMAPGATAPVFSPAAAAAFPHYQQPQQQPQQQQQQN